MKLSSRKDQNLDHLSFCQVVKEANRCPLMANIHFFGRFFKSYQSIHRAFDYVRDRKKNELFANLQPLILADI